MKFIVKRIPKSLKQTAQWLPWKAVKQSDGKFKKIPKNCYTGGDGSATDPSTWGTLEQAVQAVNKYGLTGIGFVFTDNNFIVGTDLDNCRDPETGKTEQWAINIMKLMNSYTEISPSGTGFHIFSEGKKPGDKCRKGNVEIYEKNRFFTVTGDIVEGYPLAVEPRQDELNEVYEKYLNDKGTALPGNKLPLTRTVYSPNLFSELEQGGNAHYSSPSEADLAFCNMLVKKYGPDPVVIDKHLRDSKRMRAKWDEKHSSDGRTYGEMTIDKAVSSYNARPEVQAQGHIKDFIKKNNTPALKDILNNTGVIESLLVLAEVSHAQYEAALLDFKSLKDADIATIRRTVKAELKKRKEAMTHGGFVTDFLSDVPVDIPLVVPGGYTLGEDGILKLNPKGPDRMIATAPVILVGKSICINTGNHYCEALWEDGKGGWNSDTFPREVLLNSRLIVDLSACGFPISSETARQMVGYLQLFEAQNEQNFHQHRLSNRMGWQEDGGYLLGQRYVNPNGQIIRLDGTPDSDGVYFKPNDTGDLQFFNGFYTKGGKNEWLKLVDLIAPHPVAVFMFLSAMAAPVMKITGTSNFVIDLSGNTSSGKTTLLKIIASIYGNPNINASDSIIRSWNATQISIERQLGLLNGIPFILDDTKLVQYPDMLSKVIYEATMGWGRGRGSIKGTAMTSSWQSILITSGESKLVDIAKTGDGGIHGRVLGITLRPFGRITEKKAEKIAELNSIIRYNFGGMGRIFVEKLIKSKPSWPQYKMYYKRLIKQYRQDVKVHGIGDRFAEYISLIHLTGNLVKHHLGFKWDYRNSIKTVYGNIIDEMVMNSDIAKNALLYIIDHVVSRSDHFWNPKASLKQPLYGWLGAFDRQGNIGFLRDGLDSTLSKKGFEPHSVLKEWKNRDWLRINEQRGFCSKVAIEEDRKRCVVLKKEIFDKFK